MWRILGIALGMVFAVGEARAAACAPVEMLEEGIVARYGETTIVVADTSQEGVQFRLYLHPELTTWSAVVVVNGIACMRMVGQTWMLKDVAVPKGEPL